MQPSIAELSRCISRTIEELVIPELPRASWASGYLHSALVLLSVIEARATHERSSAQEEIAQLTAMLLSARAQLRDVEAARDVRRSIDQALVAAVAPELANETLETIREGLALAADTLIMWTYANKEGAAVQVAPALLESFARYRVGAVERARALLADAPSRPIF
jgi:hypothetical protein